MRKAKDGGCCCHCGDAQLHGLYYTSVYRVLDYGVESMPPQEPGDLGIPELCDDCETVRRVRADFAGHPSLAAGIYGAATADDYLRTLGLS